MRMYGWVSCGVMELLKHFGLSVMEPERAADVPGLTGLVGNGYDTWSDQKFCKARDSSVQLHVSTLCLVGSGIV